MFNIYETRTKREEMLRYLLRQDPALGLVIAFLDFEWTLRRCILSLGKSPTKVIHEKFLNINIVNKKQDDCKLQKIKAVSSLKDYQTLWKNEVSVIGFYEFFNRYVKMSEIDGMTEESLKPLRGRGNLLQPSDYLKIIYIRLRNPLIHGARTTVPDSTAKFAFNFILTCSGELCKYAENKNKSIYGKKIVRRKIQANC